MDIKKNILVVLSNHANRFADTVARYVDDHHLPWNLTIVDSGEWGADGLREDITRMGFDAVLGWANHAIQDWLAHHPLPAVMWGLVKPNARSIAFDVDHQAVGVLAARHVRDQGLRCVATVRHWNFTARRVQFAAFLAEAERLGLETRRFQPRMDLHPDDADAALAEWLRATPHPIGVLLHQDRDALILLRFCLKHGLRVPDDVAILGVDDEPIVAQAQVPLSSIELPFAGIATHMALALHRLLSGDANGGTVIQVAPLRVRARASTGPFSCGDDLIEKLRIRIAAVPGRRHRIPQLAASLRLSPAHLHRRFQAATGMTPGVYLRQCRLALAQDLLSTTDLTLAAVARRCGLTTPASLWAAFRAAGLPAPAVWRDLQRGASP